jgi:hypothetical protein
VKHGKSASTDIQGTTNICLGVCINYPKHILIIRMKYGDLEDAQQNFHHRWWEKLASHNQSKDLLLADNASQDSEILRTFIHHSDILITFKRFCENEAFHDLEIQHGILGYHSLFQGQFFLISTLHSKFNSVTTLRRWQWRSVTILLAI